MMYIGIHMHGACICTRTCSHIFSGSSLSLKQDPLWKCRKSAMTICIHIHIYTPHIGSKYVCSRILRFHVISGTRSVEVQETFIRTYVHAYVYMYMHTYAHSHTHTCMHTYR